MVNVMTLFLASFTVRLQFHACVNNNFGAVVQ